MNKIIFWFFNTISVIISCNQFYAQAEYKVTFYNCSNDGFSMIHDGINSGVMTIYENDSRKKIEYKKDKWGIGEYHFSTNNSKVRIEIENIFKQKIDTILILNKKNKNYKICEDKFKEYELKTSVEESIKNKNKWTLSFSSIGCFHQEKESIELTHKKGKVFAIHKVNEKKKNKIKLTQTKIKSLIVFEKKLKLMNRPDGGCTTSDYYTIKSEIENYEITDSSCLWSGFHYLKKNLGLG